MKKLVTIIFFVVILVCGMTTEAKTTSKKSHSRTSSKIIGNFTHEGITYSLHSNGKITANKKLSNMFSLSGSFIKRDGGRYYKAEICYVDGCSLYLILGRNVYLLDEGSCGTMTDFILNSNNTLTITETDECNGGVGEYLMNLGLSSPVVSLSYFDRVATMNWSK